MPVMRRSNCLILSARQPPFVLAGKQPYPGTRLPKLTVEKQSLRFRHGCHTSAASRCRNSSGLITRGVVPSRQGVLSLSSTCPAAQGIDPEAVAESASLWTLNDLLGHHNPTARSPNPSNSGRPRSFPGRFPFLAVPCPEPCPGRLISLCPMEAKVIDRPQRLLPCLSTVSVNYQTGCSRSKLRSGRALSTRGPSAPDNHRHPAIFPGSASLRVSLRNRTP